MFLQSLNGSWKFHKNKDVEWNNATVPGSVHLDLMNAGCIPDPFVGENEEKVQWVMEEDWEYTHNFSARTALFDQDKQFLVFDGIDTLSDVFLNDQLIGSTENMFRKYEWDVTSILQHGENVIRVLFPSPSKHIKSKLAERVFEPQNEMGILGGYYIRKAPSQFGWDWGPKLPPIGIWKDVKLEGRSNARFSDIHLQQNHLKKEIVISAEIKLEKWQDGEIGFEMIVEHPDGSKQSYEKNFDYHQFSAEIVIENPQLWYPNGYGEQPLYKVHFSIKSNDVIVDHQTKQIGLRKLVLEQKPDEWGKSFTFIVNDVPVFAKGANWIPADSFPTRLTRDRLEKLIRDTALANQNMLRVWGGGFYESEDFYDLCDQYGILVWQDIIFACYIYPLHQKPFVDNVRQEIFENVRRIRHRASLALWCGNNEMEWGWEEWVWDSAENSDLKSAYDTFFHYLLPNWMEELDSETPYWPSSPSSDTPFKNVNSQMQGDAHYWDVWHKGEPFTAYRSQYPRFMSEFGFQAFPPMETIRQYAAPEDYNLTSYVMESHQKNGNGNRFIINQMTASYRIPSKFENLMYMSLVLQAEGIRYGVEHWRRNKHRVSGTLYWQLNDCWPVASWSSIDYFGRWKALHYAAKRFYAPILLSLFDEEKHITVHLTSDLIENWSGSINWRLMKLDGEILEQGTQKVSINRLESNEVFTYDARIPDGLEREVIFVCDLYGDNKFVSSQLVTFVPDKHIRYVDPALEVTITEENDKFIYQCSVRSVARFVELKLQGTDLVFSDNYFNVTPDHAITITSPKPEGWSLEKAQYALQVMHYYKSYA